MLSSGVDMTLSQSSLPSAPEGGPTLTLETVTADQDVAHLVRASFEWTDWAEGYTLDSWSARRRKTNATAFGSRKTTSYILRDASGSYLCSCATIVRPLYYTEEGPDGSVSVHNGDGGSVIAVMTPGPNRGKGYASTMMRIVVEKERQKGLVASTLWSGIGPTFYGKLGWRAMAPRTLKIKLNNPLPTALPLHKFSAKTLTRDESYPLLDLDTALLPRDLLAAHHLAPHQRSERSSFHAVAVGVSRDAFEWITERTVSHAKDVAKLDDDAVSALPFGLVVGTLPDPPYPPLDHLPYAFAVVFISKAPSGGTLHLARVRNEPNSEDPNIAVQLSRDLFLAAVSLADRYGLHSVMALDPESIWKPGLMQGLRTACEELGFDFSDEVDHHSALPSFAWFGEHGAEWDAWKNERDVEVLWINNERYLQC
ncbi:hypothetical protein M427DRAFT_166398 [Gonapodya prolifera JEL478]|uniref:LYC1 C-terminal domain-containing protein n=1 Tax=Gonapodya prolifera (strain JEL478) TaxID=1344416 RepID=A0A139AZP1_GONPJ|nr:hypothetical protein M427DRAFT_166398 [Gonapodya prolifera JEL478]|eukprot:KXS22177.1 hypothetical protein M427DRAFT_166398 [Gonapodya prolifera JEL478]